MNKTALRNNVCLVLAVCFGCLLASCNNDNDPEVYEVKSTLAAPGQVSVTEATSSSLSFSWDYVQGAIQYGYSVSDMLGNTVGGGTTNETSATVSDLSLFTSYTISVTAIPAVAGGGISAPVSIQARTTYYDCIEDKKGNYTTGVLDDDPWTATINEDRSAADYEEGTFGVFTLKGFFNRASASLVFTVNSDNTIKILNATGYDDNGWAMVNTGRASGKYKTLYIDESSSVFDRKDTSLTYVAKFASTEAKTETFDW